jgi:uncharacterized membrane protein YciS (DUF1049 family)
MMSAPAVKDLWPHVDGHVKQIGRIIVAVGFIAGWTLAGVLWCERATMQADIAHQTALADQHRSVAARALDALNDCEYRFLTKECK